MVAVLFYFFPVEFFCDYGCVDVVDFFVVEESEESCDEEACSDGMLELFEDAEYKCGSDAVRDEDCIGVCVLVKYAGLLFECTHPVG